MSFSRACVSFLSVFSVLCAVLLGVSRSSTAHDTGTPHPHTVSLTLRGLADTWLPPAGETLTPTAMIRRHMKC